MPDNAKLVFCAMQLRGAATAEWEEFCLALRELAASQIAEMLKSPPEMLLKAQGMAHAMNEVSKTCNDAPRLYEQMLAARSEKNARRTQHAGPAANGF